MVMLSTVDSMIMGSNPAVFYFFSLVFPIFSKFFCQINSYSILCRVTGTIDTAFTLRDYCNNVLMQSDIDDDTAIPDELGSSMTDSTEKVTYSIRLISLLNHSCDKPRKWSITTKFSDVARL